MFILNNKYAIFQMFSENQVNLRLLENMRILPIIFLFFLLTICAGGQTVSKIKLQNPGLGKITLVEGKRRATIDLSRDVAGCAAGTAVIKKQYKDCAAGSAEFRMVDALLKNNQNYLLISTQAAGNCNVCGQCGANEALGLIWLKLDKSLRVLDKKSVSIDYCRMGIEPVSEIVDFNEETQSKTLRLNFKDDVLAFDFESAIFEDNSDKKSYELSHFEYNRKTPEKGFIIKTERRDKSSISEQ